MSDQIAVVTGASSGIGKAIALDLAAQGVTLYLVGRKPEALEAVAEVAKETYAAKVFCHCTDLTIDEEIHSFIAKIRDVGRLDILVHSAGIFSMGKLQDASVRTLDKQYQLNVRAPYLLTQGLLPLLISSSGQIVFVNSSIIMRAGANLTQYAATKHALKAIADGLREEVNIEFI